jgi:NADPH2:quinone reductase
MAKAVRVHTPGGPEVLKYEDVEVGKPGPGQVRIRHHAIGVNFIDTYFRTGLYPAPSQPFVLGNEGAGEVVEVGEGVTGFKPGDRVAYVITLGAYAEERVADAKSVVKLPDGIDYDTAAAMMLKGMTVQYLLRRTFAVKPGDTILFHAAAGGVGLIATQWAKHLGATVIGTAGSPEKAELAKRNGADHVILYREEDVAKRVREITGGEGVPVVYDGVGKATFMGSLDSLKPFGVLVSFGSASGPIDAFNIGVLAQKGSLYVTRPTLNTHTAKRETLEEISGDLFKVVSSGAVKIPIHARAKLAEAADVHRALEGRETTGATVMHP